MYTTGIITYNTLPISNKSNICFQYEREKNCLIDYPTRQVDVLRVPYQRKWISLDKNMDYQFQIEKKNQKNAAYAIQTHESQRTWCCLRAQPRTPLFQSAQKGGGGLYVTDMNRL